jgi:hypothetical protein
MDEPVDFGMQELDELSDYTSLGLNTLETVRNDRERYVDMIGSSERNAPANAFGKLRKILELNVKSDVYDSVSEYLWEQGEMVHSDNPWRAAGYERHKEMIDEAKHLETYVDFVLGHDEDEVFIDEKELDERIQTAESIDGAVANMYRIL